MIFAKADLLSLGSYYLHEAFVNPYIFQFQGPTYNSDQWWSRDHGRGAEGLSLSLGSQHNVFVQDSNIGFFFWSASQLIVFLSFLSDPVILTVT